jgi:hypothetical protein
MTELRTATQLGISEEERCALVKTLLKLEAGEIEHNQERRYQVKDGFCMEQWITTRAHASSRQGKSCGTTACLAGWAHILSDGKAFPEVSSQAPYTNMCYRLPPAIKRLFGIGNERAAEGARTPKQAAAALRHYLTTGKENWAQAIKDNPS